MFSKGICYLSEHIKVYCKQSTTSKRIVTFSVHTFSPLTPFSESIQLYLKGIVIPLTNTTFRYCFQQTRLYELSFYCQQYNITEKSLNISKNPILISGYERNEYVTDTIYDKIARPCTTTVVVVVRTHGSSGR